MNGRHGRLRLHRRSGRGQNLRVSGLAAAVLLLCGLPLLASTPPRPGKAVVVPIRGEISDVMKDSLDRRLDQALSEGAKTVIFEIDTPGGLVTSALAICQRIKDLPQEVHSVAWINHKAYSAGAMIALSCNEILMTGRSSIGACAPIMVSPTGGLEGLPAAERAKAESPILEEFRDSARRNHYDPLLIRAMVAVGEEVWWVENITSGERRFVDAHEKAKLIDQAEADKAEWRLVEKYIDPSDKKEQRAKQPVDSAEELLTLTQSEAVVYGVARGIANDLDAVTEHLGLSAPPVYREITGWEKFVMWLNSPLVRGILFAIVIMGAYTEFQHPGLILPGLTAAVALIIFLAAPYAAGLASAWTFVLLGLGLILLAIEVFVIPGHAVAGLIGVLLILVAVVGTFVPSEPVTDPANAPFFSMPKLPGTWRMLEQGILYMSGSVIISLIGILLILRYLPQLSFSQGVVAPNPDGAALALADPHQDAAQVGEIGVVTGDLRPGGQARFGHEIVDVQSQGEYVEAGRRVQVLRHEGMTIVVRPLPDDNKA